ncbi:S9 family peptidase [Desertivirga arenae]|uniref:S9 family peptidase n=1 Tax=Desertivirga arenae TaxID=2810309 RepID=UPI001A95FB3E|nr:S9 family peptidase [Pedobacter sp. SYSU D00823]
MKSSLSILLLIFSASFAQQPKDITLEDIFKKGTFRQNFVYGQQPLKDGKSYASIVRDPKSGLLTVVSNTYRDNKVARIIYSEADIVSGKDSLQVSTDFSPDETRVLLAKDEEEIYRHSRKAWYYIYNITSKKVAPVSKIGKQQFPTFSPDGNKLAYVIDNNIYILNLTSGKEEQITKDGAKNHIINGWADWVYEEEFSFARAFSWSPDGNKLAYYKFNETAVQEYSMPIYEGLYPREYRYKYPKAGEKNSEVSIHVYDSNSRITTKADVGDQTDQYLPRIKWTNLSNTLCILRLNRHQNTLDYLFTNAITGVSKVVMSEKDKAYIDIEKEQLTFLNDGKRFFNVSERDGFNHIYLYNNEGKVLKQLTKGSWEVTQVYGVDEKKGLIFFQSTESSPLRRDVYSISIDGTEKKKLSLIPGTNSADFSSDFSYYTLSHSTINEPLYITLHEKSGKLVRVLEENLALKQRLKQFGYRGSEFFQFKTSQGIELNGYMIKPKNFDVKQKYPVLLYVYGGPGSQNADDNFGGTRDIWFNMLAQKGYIIACVDNRGTGFRGAEFKKVTYKQLGKLEAIDQIETAKWFASQPYVDSGRIGIWGWSFGGYLSSLCATKGNGIFKMAMAVAPVTTWRFYDSIYTERFLQTPQENPEGYDSNSPIQFAKDLKGKFLLVHGTADDNVHFQNSAMFSEALIQAGKSFEQAYYPNKNHGIYGGNTTFHLYSKLTDFIFKNL